MDLFSQVFQWLGFGRYNSVEQAVVDGEVGELQLDRYGRLRVVDMASRPAVSLKAVTPNDSTDLPDGTCRGLYVGVTGDVTLIAADDVTSSVLLKAVPVGLLNVSTKRVLSTGTTATDIVALY